MVNLTLIVFQLLVRLLQNYSRFEMRCEMRGNLKKGWEKPNGNVSIIKQFIMEKGRVRISGDVTLSFRDKVLMAFLP